MRRRRMHTPTQRDRERAARWRAMWEPILPLEGAEMRLYARGPSGSPVVQMRARIKRHQFSRPIRVDDHPTGCLYCGTRDTMRCPWHLYVSL